MGGENDLLSLHLSNFPSGPVVKNPSANADGLSPWSGKIPHAAEQLSLCVTTTKAFALEPVLYKRSHSNEKPVKCNWRVAPTSRKWRKPAHSNEDLSQPKIKYINMYFLRLWLSSTSELQT